MIKLQNVYIFYDFCNVRNDTPENLPMLSLMHTADPIMFTRSDVTVVDVQTYVKV